MLKLYNPSGQRIGALEHYENLVVEEEVSQLNLLSFDVPKEYSSLIEYEGYVETEHNGRYIIKEKSSRTNTMGYKAIYDLEDLNGHIESKAYVSMTLSAMMADLLAGTGWVINTSDTSLRTATAVTIDRLDLIYAIVRDTFGLEIKFDNQAKVITAEQYLGSDKGVYFHDEVNLIELQVDGDTYDFATRIIPRGADGLSIESVNGGLPYLENTQHSSKIITRYWSDERYTIPENLKAAAQLKLDAMSKPLKSYAARVVDLARIAEISILEYSPGDVITLVDRDSGIKEKQRIIVRRKYLDEPERDTITIANRLRQMDDSIKTEFDGVRQDFSVIRATLQALDEKILLRVAQNVYDADKTAMDLAYAQLQVDIGGVSADVLGLEGNVSVLELTASNFQVALGNVENDVANVKLQITPEAITETVEANSAVLAKKADVQLVSDAWQASFQAISIGGTNLVLDSERERVSTEYNVSIWYMSEDWIPGEEYTISFKGEVTPGTFGVWRDGGSVLAAFPTYDPEKDLWVATFICPDPYPGQPNTGAFSIYNYPDQVGKSAKVSRIKLEKGKHRTDYSPSPLELYTGITRIDADGVRVSKSNSDVSSRLMNDGLSVFDGNILLAVFGESGAVIPKADIGDITNAYIFKKVTGRIVTVGAGKEFSTLDEAFDTLFAGPIKYLEGTMTFDLYGSLSGNASLTGVVGGIIRITTENMTSFSGSMTFTDCSSYIMVLGDQYSMKLIRGSIYLYRCLNAQIRGFNISGSYGVVATDGSRVFVWQCDIKSSGPCLQATNNGEITALLVKGNGSYGSYADTGGKIYLRGTAPKGSVMNNRDYSSGLDGFIYPYGTVTYTDSEFSPPAITYQTVKQVFNASEILTVVHNTSTKNTYYGSSAAQNRWSTSNQMNDGVIKFGRNVSDFFSGGTDIVVKMRIRRKNSSHGTSGNIAPFAYRVNGTPWSSSFSAVPRGGWTNWVTIPKEYFSDSGAEFKLYNGVTGVAGYAIFDACEVEVTATKQI